MKSAFCPLGRHASPRRAVIRLLPHPAADGDLRPCRDRGTRRIQRRAPPRAGRVLRCLDRVRPPVFPQNHRMIRVRPVMPEHEPRPTARRAARELHLQHERAVLERVLGHTVALSQVNSHHHRKYRVGRKQG